MSSRHPFRFGCLLYQPFDGKTWADTAREVEALGYASIGLTDHFQTQHAPIPTMATITAATDTLVAASMVLDNDFRHPIVLAKELASLDLESGGRIEFGIGAGWKTYDYDVSGIPYDRPGIRVSRMIEAVEVIQRCFTGEEFSFAGDHYTITDYAALPLPHTPGGPKLFIGGGSPRVLRFAGSAASIVGINPNLAAGAASVESSREASADGFAQKLRWVAEGAGDRFDDLELTTILTMARVVETAAERSAAIAEACERFELDEAGVLELQSVLIGTADEIADTLIERRERFGLSYIVTVPDAVHGFVPVIERLRGR